MSRRKKGVPQKKSIDDVDRDTENDSARVYNLRGQAEMIRKFNRFANVTSIDVQNETLHQEDVRALAAALGESQILTSINLRKTGLGDLEVICLADALKKNSSLTTIHLGKNKVGDQGAIALADALKVNSSVTTLRLLMNRIGDPGATALAAAFEQNSSVSSISLGENQIGDEGAIALGAALERNSCITTVWLLKNQIGDRGAKAIGSALKINSTITSLYLGQNKIGDSGAQSLVASLGRNKSVSFVDLRNNMIGAGTAKLLSLVLQKNNTLTCIDLSGNEIGDGVKFFAAALEKNKSLTSLDLSRNGIDGGIGALASALEKNRTMTSLIVTDNKISSAARIALGTALKKNVTIRENFWAAVESGNMEEVKIFLHEGVDTVSLTNGLTVLHLAVDAGQWNVLEVLMKHTMCKPLFSMEVKSDRKTAQEEILLQCPPCLNPRLWIQIPGAPISSVVAEFANCCKTFHQELDKLTSNPSCNDAQARTIRAFDCVKQRDTEVQLISLQEIERLLVVDEIGFKLRQRERERALQIVLDQIQAVATFIEACSGEMEVLAPWVVGCKNVVLSSKNFDDALAKAGLALEKLDFDFAKVLSIEESMREKVVQLADNWSLQGTMMLEKFIATARSTLKHILQSNLAHESMNLINECKGLVVQRFQKRWHQLQKQQSDVIHFGCILSTKRVELQKVLDAEKEIDAVQKRVAETFGKLEQSKISMQQLELNLKKANFDKKLNVKKIQSQLQKAKKVVEESRHLYEAAVKSLVDLRQVGFPELRCVAAAKVDRFPVVPLISFNELSVVKKIGGGAFADVLKVELPVNGMCAFKQLRKHVSDDELMKEAAAMWDMRFSDHIVKLLKVCREPENQGLLLELAEGGSLGDLIYKRKEKLREQDVLQILHDVATGLEFVHHHKHVHLDIKAENILLFGGLRAKLSDFGAAKQACTTFRDTKIAFTLQWSAPELLTSLPRFSSACDVWSFGMLMYEVLTGHVPFDGMETHALIQAIASGELPRIPAEVKPELAHLMQCCWKREPNERPAAEDLQTAIGNLMTVQCTNCSQPVTLTNGVFCKAGKLFVCSACVPERIQSNLRSGVIRSDGALDLGDQRVIELETLRPFLSEEVLAVWLKGKEEATESEVRLRIQAELERAKREWETSSVDARIADCIRFDVLPCRCPDCTTRFAYEGGCFALTCAQCKASFCAFCEVVFANGALTHDHVANCKQNVLKVPWYPDHEMAKATFESVQKVRQIRDIRRKLEHIDDELRQKVIERIKNELAQNGIQPSDL